MEISSQAYSDDMNNFIIYANGVEKSAIILDSVFAEELFNRNCKPNRRKIRERIEKVSQMMKKQINRKYDEREVLFYGWNFSKNR